jgi:PhnB protein
MESDHSVISIHIIAKPAAAASQWYQQVFAAVEQSRLEVGGQRLIDVRLDVGGTEVVLADEFPEHGALAPTTTGESSAVFYLHTDDVDAVWERALANGAEVIRALADTFWGEREGQVLDPFGHKWGITQHVRDVPHDEVAALAAQAFASPEA